MSHKLPINLLLTILITAVSSCSRSADSDDDLLWGMAFHRVGEDRARHFEHGINQMRQGHADMVAALASSREAYWAAYANGKNLDQLGEAYAKALQEKDAFYLAKELMSEVTRRAGGNSALPGILLSTAGVESVDGGIHGEGFGDWVTAVKREAGRGVIANWAAALSAPSSQDAYKKYCRSRDVEEYLRHAPTSPRLSSEPLKHFEYLYLSGGDTLSSGKADTSYQLLTQLLGKELIDQALQDEPKVPRSFMTLVDTAAEASPSDHVFLLAFLKKEPCGEETPRQLPELYAAAENQYQKLLKQFGHERIASDVQKMRTGFLKVQKGFRGSLTKDGRRVDSWVDLPWSDLIRLRFEVQAEASELFSER